jgi:4-amino-4-deoxy-L-arabinose transferase-like glycosyltransferase
MNHHAHNAPRVRRYAQSVNILIATSTKSCNGSRGRAWLPAGVLLRRYDPGKSAGPASVTRGTANRKEAGLTAVSTPVRLLNRFRAVPRSTTLEIAAIAAITLLALFLRFYDLTSLPNGMHGDEAVAGIEAQRIIDHGGIGVYSPLAAGQPAGPLYLFAVAIGLFGHTLFAVRLVPALLGTLTIPLLYAVVRRSLGREVALASAFFFAVMGWHIHFARIGFPLESWPFFTLLAYGALVEAVRSGSWRWWTAAGALMSVGIYVYNGHPPVLAATALFLCGFVMVRGRKQLLPNVGALLTFIAAAFVIAVPMISYAADDSNGFFDHIDRDRITAAAD